MKRGDVVLIAFKGDYGKLRPAVVIQNDLFADELPSRTLCLVTTELSNSALRMSVEPTTENGLRDPSQVQVDKIMTAPSRKMRGPIGRLTGAQMRDLDRRLLVHLGIRGYALD